MVGPALALGPDHAVHVAYYDLGVLYTQDKKNAEAREAFEKYLKYGVHEDAASRKEAEERLKTFKSSK